MINHSWQLRVSDARSIAAKLGMFLFEDMLSEDIVYLYDGHIFNKVITSGDIKHIEDFLYRCYKLKAFL
jgi:hypothetical protein